MTLTWAQLRDNRHLILGWTWVVLAVPTVLFWKEAILWIAIMSLYANAEASFSAHQAAQSRAR